MYADQSYQCEITHEISEQCIHIYLQNEGAGFELLLAPAGGGLGFYAIDIHLP